MVGVERILQLLGYLAALVGVLPLLPFLDLWVLALLGLGFLLGVGGDLQRKYLLGNRLATLLSIGFFGLFIFQASIANLVAPLIQLLCLLLAVRLASDKSARHMLQIFLLATIVLAASSMLTLNMIYMLYLVLIVLLVTSGLVLLSFYVTDPQIRFGRRQWSLLLKTIAVLPLGSLLLMLVLFVILPRTETPLWNFLNPKPAASSGMRVRGSPGSVLGLAESGEIAFRAETERLPADLLYWRGIVLNRLDGQVWRRSAYLAEEKILSDPGSEIVLTIFSEPKADRYLVTLDRPLLVERIRNQRSSDGVVRGNFRDNRKISYQVQAQYRARSQQIGDLSDYLRLPGGFSSRLQSVADQIRRGATYQQKRDLLDEYFLQQQLSYSTTRLPKTVNPVETFLFESKRGYCEYFASSYAVLLRMSGVPARLVGGYLGGEFNQLGGYYLVGEDAAHVWVEALDDEGIWQRIDPSRLAVNATEAFALSQRDGLASLQAFTDALMHNWSRLVLNYDLRQQFGLVRSVVNKVRGLKNIDSSAASSLLWLSPVLLLIGAWHFWQQRQTRAVRLLSRYRKLMAKAAGVEVLPARLGLFELAELSNQPLCREFAEIYGGSLYRDRSLSDAAFQRLNVIVDELKQNQTAIEVAKPTPLGDNMRP